MYGGESIMENRIFALRRINEPSSEISFKVNRKHILTIDSCLSSTVSCLPLSRLCLEAVPIAYKRNCARAIHEIVTPLFHRRIDGRRSCGFTYRPFSLLPSQHTTPPISLSG